MEEFANSLKSLHFIITKCKSRKADQFKSTQLARDRDGVKKDALVSDLSTITHSAPNTMSNFAFSSSDILQKNSVQNRNKNNGNKVFRVRIKS